MRIRFKNVYFFVGYFLLILLSSFIFSNPVKADVTGWAGDKLIQGFGWIVYVVVFTIGKFTSFLLGWLVQVASFSNFINISTVTMGWVIVRDLCNMFFILILLVIAFATILRIPNYEWKKLLPKLLIMAVLINFSKTICGLIIDFSQVIMLTFVNGISSGASNNLTRLLGMDKMMAFNANAADKVSGSLGMETVAGLILALLSALVILVVIGVMIAMLVMRVIMIWIYVILSPIAFLAAAFPAGQKYSSQWWGEFSKNVIVGPVLAFFLWLALMSAQSSSDSLGLEKITAAGLNQGILTGMLEGKTFQTYIITLGLLIGGLMVTQQMGGIAASIAGKGMAAIQKGGAIAGAVALSPLAGAKKLAGFGLDKISSGIGIDLNVARGWKRLTTQMDENKRVRENKVYGRAVETAQKGGFFRSKLALGSTGDLGWQNVVNLNKGRNAGRFLMGGKWAEKFHKQAGVLSEERKGVMTNEEYDKKLEGKKDQKDQYEESLYLKDQEIQKETDPTKKSNREREKEEMQKKYDEFVNNDFKPFENKQDITVDDKKAQDLDKKIKEVKEKDKNWSLMGADTALARNKAEAENLQRKNVENIENADQLGKILQQAVATGNEGLIAAVSKKMTRNYDYNEMCKSMGVGTGRDGLLKMAQKFQDEGGMTKDASLGLLGEIGVIAKNIGHFGAFGAVKMQDGRWEESNDDEYNEIMLAEMLKKEPQNFAMTVNRLGLGHYDGPEQSVDNWHMSKAATAYITLNGDALAEQYKSRGMQNALEHIYSKIEMLEKNNATPKLIDTITNRARGKGRGADVREVIRAVKT